MIPQAYRPHLVSDAPSVVSEKGPAFAICDSNAEHEQDFKTAHNPHSTSDDFSMDLKWVGSQDGPYHPSALTTLGE